jgi:hypothetical protein
LDFFRRRIPPIDIHHGAHFNSAERFLILYIRINAEDKVHEPRKISPICWAHQELD